MLFIEVAQINAHSVPDWPVYSDLMVTFCTPRNQLCMATMDIHNSRIYRDIQGDHGGLGTNSCFKANVTTIPALNQRVCAQTTTVTLC